jgi:peroxisomal membrane protein 2
MKQAMKSFQITIVSASLVVAQAFAPLARQNLHPMRSSLRHLSPTADLFKSTTTLNLGVQEAWTAYNDALQSDPLVVKSVTACVILGFADLAGQALQAKLQDGNGQEAAPVDIARTARFAFFGLVLQAPWNHFYYQFLDGAIPPTPEPWTTTTGIKVVIDQFVQAPIFTVLIFAFLGFLEGKSAAAIKQQLDEDYVDTMLANWKLWIPATIVNIAFVPPILRVLYLNCVFFFWSIFLSLKLNKDA